MPPQRRRPREPALGSALSGEQRHLTRLDLPYKCFLVGLACCSSSRRRGECGGADLLKGSGRFECVTSAADVTARTVPGKSRRPLGIP